MAETLKDRLQRRNEERLATIEKRRADKESNEQPTETRDFFTSAFTKEKGDIDEMLRKSATSIEAGNKMQAIEFFDSLANRCQKLQKLLTDSVMFLPSREIQVSQDALKALQDSINEKREEYLPKKKFAFKARKKETSASANKQQELQISDETKEDLLSTTEKKFLEATLGFKGITGQTLTMSPSQVKSQDISLRGLHNCNIVVYGAPSALHVYELTDCTVLCGPVGGAVFIEDCSGCNFVFPCHQLRAHSTTNSKFYLHVTSRAIVEDCSNVGFAPFNWDYDSLESDYKSAGLDPSENNNNWSLVNDFNWLKTDEPSPNWFIIEENQRKDKWIL